MFISKDHFDETKAVVEDCFKDMLGKGVSIRKHFALGRLKVLYVTCYYKIPKPPQKELKEEGESEYSYFIISYPFIDPKKR